MQGNTGGFGQTGGRSALALFKMDAFRLLLDGISARAHAVAGTRPSARPAPARVVGEEQGPR